MKEILCWAVRAIRWLDCLPGTGVQLWGPGMTHGSESLELFGTSGQPLEAMGSRQRGYTASEEGKQMGLGIHTGPGPV